MSTRTQAGWLVRIYVLPSDTYTLRKALQYFHIKQLNLNVKCCMKITGISLSFKYQYWHIGWAILITSPLCFSPGKHADTGWEIWGAAHVMQTSDIPPDVTKLKQVALSGAFESKMWTTWSWGFFWYHTKCPHLDGVCEVKDITNDLKFACGFHSLASLNLEESAES